MWQISVSMGIAQAPEDGTTGDELNRRAALALRAAKRAGRGTVRRFVPQIQEEHAERRFFLRELEAAIRTRRSRFTISRWSPPRAAALSASKRCCAGRHPTRGAIAPSMFIPLAEESGLMVELGEIVLRRALNDGARWPELFVSVNLSPVQMRSRDLVELLGAVARRNRHAGRRASSSK